MSILQPGESFVRAGRICPKCGHRTRTMHTWEPIRCRAKVKNLARRKGEPRLIDCGTVMEPIKGPTP